MIAAGLKFAHIGAIALWSAGLIALPFLYRQRRGLVDEKLHRLHAVTRFFYVALVSPAAFIAIATGTGLIFVQSTYDGWFLAKLALVALMAGIHIFSGLVILRLFEPGETYPFWRFALVLPLTLLVIGTILFLVLDKPALGLPEEIMALFEPGALAGLTAGWR